MNLPAIASILAPRCQRIATYDTRVMYFSTARVASESQPPPFLTLENLALLAVSLAGAGALLLPFIIATFRGSLSTAQSHASDASLLLALVVGVSLFIAVAELLRGVAPGGLARSVALLAALVAVDA